jgi:bacterioferritin
MAVALHRIGIIALHRFRCCHLQKGHSSDIGSISPSPGVSGLDCPVEHAGQPAALFSRSTKQERTMDDSEKQLAITALNRIMELELAGVVKYTHYSLMVYGYNRIPIVSWLKDNAQEGLLHAHKAGELVTLLGGHPSLKIGELLETARHDIGEILRESLEHEKNALAAYYDLLNIASGQSVLLEEYAREMIVLEEMHLDEVNKMLRRPGAIESFTP